jgi:hypothetical protein
MGRPTAQAILRSVNRLLESLGTLSPVAETRAEIARNLARQLDAMAPGGTNGAQAQAVPSITRELQRTIESILRSNPEQDSFLDSLFADDDGNDVRIQIRANRTAFGIEVDDE